MRGFFDALFGKSCTKYCECKCNCGCGCSLGSEIELAPFPAYGEIVTETSISRYMNVPMKIVTLGPSVGVCAAGASTCCGCGCGCGGCGCGGCGGCGSWGCGCW